MSSSDSSVDDAQKFLRISQSLNGIVGLPIVILGISGNFLIILDLLLRHSLNKLTSCLFLLASVISGQFVLFALIPRVIFGLTGNDPTNWSIFLCKTRLFIAYSCSGYSICCTCLVAIDQYLLSCPQIWRHRLLNRRRAYWILLILALFWFIAYFPHTIFYTLIPSNNETFICMNTNPIYGTYVSYFALIAYSISPVIILIVFSFLILINLRRFQHIIRQRSTNLQRSVTKLMITFILLISLAAFPTTINQIYLMSTLSSTKSRFRISIEYFLLTILALLTYLSYGSTFYMFILVSDSFRQNNKNILIKLFNYFYHLNRQDRITPQQIMLRQIQRI